VTVERSPGGSRRWTEDGTYIAEAQYRGRHIGRFLGIEPTGREIGFRFVVILGFRDGLMAGERFYYDLAHLPRQLGVERLSLA
jgi:predicted ester cyclase